MRPRLLAAVVWIVLLCASLTASAAIPQSEHDALHKARGTFQIQGLGQSIYSTVIDINTLNDPPCP